MHQFTLFVEDNSWNRNLHLFECEAPTQEEAFARLIKRKPRLEGSQIVKVLKDNEVQFIDQQYASEQHYQKFATQSNKLYRLTIWLIDSSTRYDARRTSTIDLAAEKAKNGLVVSELHAFEL